MPIFSSVRRKNPLLVQTWNQLTGLLFSSLILDELETGKGLGVKNELTSGVKIFTVVLTFTVTA
jgi:hypothetical protein